VAKRIRGPLSKRFNRKNPDQGMEEVGGGESDQKEKDQLIHKREK